MRISDWSSDVCSSDLDLPRAVQVIGGEAVSVGEHFVKRTLRHDLPAVDARAGAHVHDVIGGADRILVMLHDDDGVAEVAEALQGDEDRKSTRLNSSH